MEISLFTRVDIYKGPLLSEMADLIAWFVCTDHGVRVLGGIAVFSYQFFKFICIYSSLQCDIPSRTPWDFSEFFPASFQALILCFLLLVFHSWCSFPLVALHSRCTSLPLTCCCCALALSTQNPDTEPTQSSSWGQDRIKHPHDGVIHYCYLLIKWSKWAQFRFRPHPQEHRPLLVTKSVSTRLLCLSFHLSPTGNPLSLSFSLLSLSSPLSFSCLLWLPRCRRAKTLIPSFAPLTGRARRSRCLAGLCLSGPPRCRGWLLNHRYSSYKFSSPGFAGLFEATQFGWTGLKWILQWLDYTAVHYVAVLFISVLLCGWSCQVCRRTVSFVRRDREKEKDSSLKCWNDVSLDVLCAEGQAAWMGVKNCNGILWMAHVYSLMASTVSKQLGSEHVNVFTPFSLEAPSNETCHKGPCYMLVEWLAVLLLIPGIGVENYAWKTTQNHM